MAARVANRTLVSLLPTAHVAKSGAPLAAGINFAARGPASDHHHHDGPTTRSDVPPAWASSVRLSPAGLVSKSRVNGKYNYTKNPTLLAHFGAFTALPTGPGSFRTVHTTAITQRDTHVPDFSPYRAKSDDGNRALSYFMIGSMGVLSATAAKSTVTDFLASMAASADVLALAKVEVDMNSIPEGKNVIVKWRGKPVFIRHRTQEEIDEANTVDIKALRDPESDSARTKKPEWLVMLGVCTHLGCVPIGESGDYGGW